MNDYRAYRGDSGTHGDGTGEGRDHHYNYHERGRERERDEGYGTTEGRPVDGTDGRVDYDRMFREMKARIDDLRDRLAVLDELHATVANRQNDLFDAEDLQTVGRAAAAQAEQLQQLEAEYDHRRHYHEKVVVQMRENLDARQRLLEDLDRTKRVLGDNPDLQGFFVKKQSVLLGMYEEVCDRLAG